jgi:release factor glutamine methyltransferase
VTLPTVGGLIGQSAGYLEGRGVPSPKLDAERLLAHALGVARLDLYLQYDRPLEPAEVDAFRELVRRRARREPLAYVLGSWGFRHLDIACDARALVPRPETEQLVELALGAADGSLGSVLDLGTGTGAIALAVAQERPGASVTAVDVSPDALALAAENAARNDLGGRVELLHGDLFGPVAGRRFDLVVANLPYVGDGDPVDPELAFEPDVALYAGDAGRELLERLAREAPAHLGPGGHLAAEVGLDQAPWLAERLEAAGLAEARVERDLAGRERFVLARQR